MSVGQTRKISVSALSSRASPSSSRLPHPHLFLTHAQRHTQTRQPDTATQSAGGVSMRDLGGAPYAWIGVLTLPRWWRDRRCRGRKGGGRGGQVIEFGSVEIRMNTAWSPQESGDCVESELSWRLALRSATMVGNRGVHGGAPLGHHITLNAVELTSSMH